MLGSLISRQSRVAAKQALISGVGAYLIRQESRRLSHFPKVLIPCKTPGIKNYLLVYRNLYDLCKTSLFARSEG